MHDPKTVAFDIKYPWWHRGFRGERAHATFITIWHVDPETDGSDDSCGWFKRARHGDPKVLKSICGDFDFNWDADYGGWFDKDGSPLMSTPGIVLGMFRIAARAHFGSWDKATPFVRRHLTEILFFAENPTDSMHPSIVQKYGRVARSERIEGAASVVYGCILRWTQPWYRHARWHVWHWELQIHPLQAFKRWAFSRCQGCGRRFTWGYCPTSTSWSGGGPRWFKSETHIYHSGCCPGSKPVMHPEPPSVGQAVH